VGYATAFPVHRLGQLLEVLPPVARIGEGHGNDVVGNGQVPRGLQPACHPAGKFLMYVDEGALFGRG
jgi:hypothetical protein